MYECEFGSVRVRRGLSDSDHDRVNVCACLLVCIAPLVRLYADVHACPDACALRCVGDALLEPEPSQLTFRLAFLPLFLAALPASGLLAAQEKEEALHPPG